MRARVEKTLPWSSGGAFDCQMARLQPFVMGLANMNMKPAAIQSGALHPRPMIVLPSRALVVRRTRPFLSRSWVLGWCLWASFGLAPWAVWVYIKAALVLYSLVVSCFRERLFTGRLFSVVCVAAVV